MDLSLNTCCLGSVLAVDPVDGHPLVLNSKGVDGIPQLFEGFFEIVVYNN